MKRALSLAARGRGWTSPNPLVGAVCVKGGKIIGEGYHRFYGDLHAEAHALRRAGSWARGATLYVTLEPCAHSGKTSPCVKAILKSGVRRVVAAMRDPNPAVAGKGLRRLRAGGVRVETSLLEKEARRLNEGYLSRLKRKRPFVTLKAAVTLDGKTATEAGRSRWISSQASRRLVHSLRAAMDAILVGANTVRRDNPKLTSHGRGRNPLRVVMTSALEIPKSARLLNGLPGETLLACADSVSQKRIQGFTDQGVAVISLPKKDGRASPRAVLTFLAEMGIANLLLEGGGELNASFLRENLVDRLLLFVSPKIVGGRLAPTLAGGEGTLTMASAKRFRIMETQRIAEDLLIVAEPV